MKRYLIRRLVFSAALFIGITFLSFIVIHLAPGSAVDTQTDMNLKMTLSAKEKMARMYGLDRPLLVQYTDWLGRLVRLDFGQSFTDQEKVIVKIGRALPITLCINLIALTFMIVLGVMMGVITAVRRGGWIDRLWTFFAFSAISAPSFWASLLLISLFGVGWGLLPVSGVQSLFADEMDFIPKIIDYARHLILPVTVIAMPGIASFSRYVRSGLLEVLTKPYVRAARAKGIPELKVVFLHALPNALLPVVTLLGLSIPGLLGGSILVETIFSIPGMGRLFYSSVFTRDYPVIMAILVIGAVLTLLGNILADLSCAFLDPRIRLGAKI